MHTRYLIVGNGVAGINAAKTLVQNDPDGEIAVYAAERYPYYNRWQLPALLAGHKSQPDIQFYPEQWYVEQGIQVHLDSPVQALEPAAKRVILANGQAMGLYPLRVIFHLLPLPQAYGVFIVVQLGLAGIWMYVLARVLGANRLGGLRVVGDDLVVGA